jgi:hypothetical protein
MKRTGPTPRCTPRGEWHNASLARRRLACSAWLLLGGCQALAASTDADTAAAQRQAIRQERAAVEARFQQGEAQCKQRFAVSGCVADLQTQRRRELAALRERELVLDEAQRKADAEANARRLQAKRDAAQDRPPPQARAQTAAAAGSAPASSASSSASSERARRRSKTADDAAAAAARVVAQERHASEAAAHRQAVEQRNVERAAKGKKSTPLPTPAASAAAPN